MKMMEDLECPNCDKTRTHLCNTVDNLIAAYGTKSCPYCGAKDVSPRHICKAAVPHLTHICMHCGRVTDDPDLLCHPLPIEESVKAKWAKAANKRGEIIFCGVCDQPITKGPGHLCDLKLPYSCRFCGANVTNLYHMCQGIIKNAKVYCNLCGRIGVEDEDVCAPLPLK